MMTEVGTREKEQPSINVCLACQSEIAPLAAKCIKCGSFQNWRRFVDLSSTTLALAIAFLSTLGLVSPIFARLFLQESKAVLDEQLQGLFDNKFYVAVSNEGAKAGAVNGARLLTDEITADGLHLEKTIAELPFEPLMVMPGTARQVRVPVPPSQWPSIERAFVQYRAAGKELPQLSLAIAHSELNEGDWGGEKPLSIDWGALLALSPNPWMRCVGDLQYSRVNPDDPVSISFIINDMSISELEEHCGSLSYSQG